MDICIGVLNGGERGQKYKWLSGRIPPAMRDAYVSYKERPHYYRETPYITGEYIVYRIDNDPYLPTYIAKTTDIPLLENGIGAGLAVGQRNNLANNITITRDIHATMIASSLTTPIIDMFDVYVFIVDNPGMGRANWLRAREYQAWAYRDFMYSEDVYNRQSGESDGRVGVRGGGGGGGQYKKSYMSNGSSYLAFSSNINQNNVTTIDLSNIQPNIIFNISRNENNSVYYERNDDSNSRVRLCDNEYARAGYLGFYTRITMDPGIIITPPPPAMYSGSGSGISTGLLSTNHLPEPVETNNEEQQCILCCKFQVNMKISPCEHKICCSICYSKLSTNKCPVCRADITRVMNV
jgi:hypothetical protein